MSRPSKDETQGPWWAAGLLKTLQKRHANFSRTAAKRAAEQHMKRPTKLTRRGLP